MIVGDAVSFPVMYPVLALDLDHTLLDEREQVPPSVQQSLRMFRATGGRITLVTGRRWAASRHVAEALQVDLPVVCQNGALILDPRTERVLHLEPLPQGVVAYLVRRGIPLIVTAGDSNYLYPPDARGFDSYRQYPDTHVVNHPGDLLALKGITRVIYFEAPLLRFPGTRTYPNRDGSHYVVRDRATKAVGLAWVLRMHAIHPQRVLFFGDGWLDLSLFLTLPYSVGVSSMPLSLQHYVSDLAPHHARAGVYRYLRRRGVVPPVNAERTS